MKSNKSFLILRDSFERRILIPSFFFLSPNVFLNVRIFQSKMFDFEFDFEYEFDFDFKFDFEFDFELSNN